MKYKAVFFDFDYTLGDATDAIYAGFKAGMAALGQPVPDREAVRYTVGQPLEVAYTNLTDDADPDHQAQFRAAFSAVARPMQQTVGVPLFPGAADLLLPGDADEVPVASTVTNAGDAPLSTLTLRCGDTSMTFEGLSIAPGASLRLWTEGGVLHAEDVGGGGDLIMCRTGDSHDLLLADCGRATAVSVTADQAVEAVFHARGRML